MLMPLTVSTALRSLLPWPTGAVPDGGLDLFGVCSITQEVWTSTKRELLCQLDWKSSSCLPLTFRERPSGYKKRNSRRLISLATMLLYCSHHFTQLLRTRAQAFQFWKIQVGTVNSISPLPSQKFLPQMFISHASTFDPCQERSQGNRTFVYRVEINFLHNTTTHTELPLFGSSSSLFWDQGIRD